MDLIAVGRISSVYPDKYMAKVIRDDTGTVTRELTILDRGDNWLPIVGEYVVVAFLPRSSAGYILGGVNRGGSS